MKRIQNEEIWVKNDNEIWIEIERYLGEEFFRIKNQSIRDIEMEIYQPTINKIQLEVKKNIKYTKNNCDKYPVYIDTDRNFYFINYTYCDPIGIDAEYIYFIMKQVPEIEKTLRKKKIEKLNNL